MPQRDSRLSAAIALLLIVAAANLGLIARLYGQAHGGQAFFCRDESMDFVAARGVGVAG